MKFIDFELKGGDYIELIQLLKAIGVAQTGRHAKRMVEDKEIIREGEVESRKRAKLKKGDSIVVNNQVKIVIS